MNQEMITFHKPGADNMTLSQKLRHISLQGQIRIVLVTHRDENTIPTGAMIAWYANPNSLLNKQLSNGNS